MRNKIQAHIYHIYSMMKSKESELTKAKAVMRGKKMMERRVVWLCEECKRGWTIKEKQMPATNLI
jgi:rubrerythrin